MGTKLAFAVLCSITAALAQVAVAPTATPTSVTFTYQIGSALPATQTVAVKGGPAVATYSTAVNPATALWVAATPETGQATLVITNVAAADSATYSVVVSNPSTTLTSSPSQLRMLNHGYWEPIKK